MVKLRETPYNLEYLDYVRAKIQAHNERGWSSESTISLGPQI